ncbi:NPCBM/NEW2 domain-containing protein [Streptomyces sp. NPDC050600]|uniref:NPCBM/NEW2 domain-containing protein n=1 Tax=Streptomyces sp. NPDC050600 TaxID=3157213 RepID=UPI00343D14E0
MRRLPTRTTRARETLTALAAVTLLGAAGLAAPATADATTAAPGPAPVPATSVTGDGIALTPPMGFNNWNSTHCRAEFNETMVKGIADIFIERGLKDAGYRYVNIDDCWALPERDADGKLVPDPARFPHGIKAVADYVHSKGLKFGLYTSAGTRTCDGSGFPGALGHEYSDARQFADWGVDYLKYDNCNNQGVDAKGRYITMRDALRATGRPIVYSICEWGENKPWEWAGDVGQLWRTTYDINDSWGSMLSIMKQNLPLSRYAGPGRWNDPDMLEVGNGGMTDTEYRSHFSMWSMMASPLLIGSDLRKATPAAFEILANREVIAVDQDPLGKQGTVVSSSSGRWVVVKELADGSRAVALFNETESAQRIGTTARAAGLPDADAYTVRDLWQHTTTNTAGTVSATVPAHGTVMLRLSVDDTWASYPPAVETALEAAPLLEAGKTTELTTTVTDLGRTPARDLSVALTGPAGWRIEAATPHTDGTVPTGASLATTWRLTAPAGTPTGAYALTLTADYRSPLGVTARSVLPVRTHVVVAPPAGTSYLSDLPWLAAANGWGPVERDAANGENQAGDSGPLTIGGTVFAKGLGAHAHSDVEFYTGSACTTVSALVGLDDESGAHGTVAFEIWADGRKAASTGVLTNDAPAQPLKADITGARTVHLVVTDGGDGIGYDHADWADAKLSC